MVSFWGGATNKTCKNYESLDCATAAISVKQFRLSFIHTSADHHNDNNVNNTVDG